ncbi:hypothetical protein PPYR_10897 [Photinus pyralis]|uniref:Exonuclease domain-containing protein n=1 Tax=Photinus pyralis TaxID=7054 RepID=A0A1Y1MQH1_PHOPY|nr:three-prime repair exonuclease 1 [Photinus pyralis]KAB0796836.1 hypothetical protein PPYR_10897 [Photinus pyralis]
MQIKLFKSCKFHQFLSLRNAMDIKTFIFLDCETTGLPFQESNKTRITELCFVAVQSDHISLGVFPRIQNKLNFCFNPRKFISTEASRITGLTNELLEHQTEFDVSCFSVMREFLNANRKPICLVAHNGNKFDYPILKAEIYKTGNEMASDVLCIDSLVAFRNLHENSMKRTALPEPVSQVPWELNDGFDDILGDVVDNIDLQTSSQPKLTVAEIQKINETTPVKNVGGFKFRAVKRKKIFTEKLSFSLGNLYQRLTSKAPVDAHRAECDVNMLIECAATVGQPFVDWCNENAQQFCDIPMMVPGKPIGS